jgi:N-sulfoglucosamine sulfohydrolase
MNKISRRHLLGAAVGAAVAKRGEAASRPNILFAIADDWSWPFAGIGGDRSVQTPNFDRVAREGVLFRHCYAVAPSCTASRGSILTGQWFARLEEGADLWSTLPAKFDVYPDLLERDGYTVGFTGKGWGPGDFRPGGRTRNPAGPEYNKRLLKPPTTGIHNLDYAANFSDFLAQRKSGQPFCFWYGGHEPHRPYEKGSGLKAGKKLADVRVPGGMPDAEEVRSDLLDYAREIDWFDSQLGLILAQIEKAGELENTLVVVTGDNGLPFPRAKANLYDNGTHVPLAVRWGASVKGGRTIEDFISLADVAPTLLQAAGVRVPAAMTARSFLDIAMSSKSGWVDPKRERVFSGRERHTPAQPDGPGGYPMRSIRTREYLYVRNYKPERYPVGSEKGRSPYLDIDPGPTKTYMMEHRADAAVANLFELGFGKRPAEELYELRSDAAELKNRATDPKLADVRKRLASELEGQLKEWKDPRVLGGGDAFDRYPYLGENVLRDFFERGGSGTDRK